MINSFFVRIQNALHITLLSDGYAATRTFTLDWDSEDLERIPDHTEVSKELPT